MGATNFSNLAIGKFKDSTQAYNEEVEEAHYESGHDPYNGTISTTNGFNIVTDHPRFGTKAFDKWEEKLTDKLDKRDCVCVEVIGAPFKKQKYNRGYKGMKGIKMFYFFGWAAE